MRAVKRTFLPCALRGLGRLRLASALAALGLALGLAFSDLARPVPAQAASRNTNDDPISLYGEDESPSLVLRQAGAFHPRQRFIFFRGIPPQQLKSSGFQQLISQYSARHGVDERLVRAVIEVESGYNAEAVSPAGAQGLMQIMPGTQKDLGLTQPFDPDLNIEAGVRYLKEQLTRFGSVELALAAYNAGPENVTRYNGIPPFAETRDYVRKVMARVR